MFMKVKYFHAVKQCLPNAHENEDNCDWAVKIVPWESCDAKFPIFHLKFKKLNVFLFRPLNVVSRVERYLWITYMNRETTGGPPLTYGQHSAGAASEDNTELNMERRKHRSNHSVYAME